MIPEIRNGHTGAGAPWSRVDFTNVAQMVAAGCRRYPSVPAVIFDDGVTISREQLLLRARRFAGYLLRHTVSGERVAVMLENRIEYMIIFVAALLTERLLVTVNPDSKTFDAVHVLRNSDSVMIVTSFAKEELAAHLKRECSALRLILTVRNPEPDGLWPFTADGELPPPEICQATRNSPATVYYTSGSTGLPKGCILGHEWWLRLCDIHLRTTPMQDDYRPLCCVPFYYADSMFQLLCALHMGGTLIATRRFSVSRFWTVVAQYGVTEIYLLASMPTLLLKQAVHPLERQHKLRIAISSPVPKNAHEDLVERFGVQFIDSYGTTEAGWNVRIPWRMAGKMVGSGSMGTAVPETELRIIGKTNTEIPVGGIGELLVRGPGLFLGYLNDPAATSQALRDGWYHTGDLVRSDDQGFLYFIARMKDVVRRSGETVSAAEVEAVLRAHPLVGDAAVVPVPDEVRGEEVKAHIWMRDVLHAQDLAARELLAHCSQRLAAFKVPRYLQFRAMDFPRTPTMRIRKEELVRLEAPCRTWDRVLDGWVVHPGDRAQ